MKLGQSEITILLVILILMVFGPAIGRRVGIRALTFDKPGDVAFGILAVTTFLMSILFLGR